MRQKRNSGVTYLCQREGKILFGIVAVFIFAVILVGAIFIFGSFEQDDLSYVATGPKDAPVKAEEIFVPTHIPTPDPVRAVYMTSWVGGVSDWRASIVKMIEETELNSIVIDIKDATGLIGFEPTDPFLKEFGSYEKRIPDAQEFIDLLHKKGIYVIGRVSVFQDPALVKKRPDLAVRKKSDGGVWKDYKGLSWLDVGATEVWDYVIAIARDSYKNIGFDEINFDYVRFPSDGDTEDIIYTHFNQASSTKPDQLEDFFAYLNFNLENEMPTSADLFGMTTSSNFDLNIGQILEKAEPYFDYIAPMVYPSHYPAGFNGHVNPNDVPYDIIKYSMDEGVKRLKKIEIEKQNLPATTTLSNIECWTCQKLRPWLQDFDYGGDYGEEEVRAQKQAVYDAGLKSWMLWDPNVKYTREALDSSI